MGRKSRRKSRSRKRGSGPSRRSFLGTGLVAVGGTLALLDFGAFSQVRGDRGVAVSSASDQNALVGLDTVGKVNEGRDGQELVTITNNADRVLDFTVEPTSASSGSISPSTVTLDSGVSQKFTVDVADTNDTSFPFDVTATDDDSLNVYLTRTVGVRVLKKEIRDRTADGHAAYRVLYRVKNVAETSFSEVRVTFDNLDSNWADDTKTNTNMEGYVEYSEGGAGGDRYEITVDVYDDTGAIILSETATDVADGTNPDGNDQIGGGPNDPQLERFEVVEDNTRNNNTEFVTEYEVSNVDTFQRVDVTFDNQENNWSDETTSNTSTPGGEVRYPEGGGSVGGVEGHRYEITAEVINENGLVVDSATRTNVADDDPDN